MSNVSPLFFFLPLVFLAPNSCRFSLSLSLSQEWDPTGYVLRFDYSSSPHPGHFFFFLSLFFLLCKIWLNVCNRTNAHGLTARSSALRCVSMESARDTSLALALPPRERSLKIRKGQSVEARARRYRRSGECVRSFRPSHRETQRELASERPKTRQ